MLQVRTYEVALYAGPRGNNGNRAVVYLRGAREQLLAVIHFRAEGEEIAEDREKLGVPHLQAPESALQTTIDLLRNEKPILFAKLGDKYRLATFEEPVGEGEG
jgi:hypothetical protein